MKSEKEHLLHDLMIADEGQRHATLLAAGGILRRRRQWRTARQACLLSALLAALVLLAGQNHRSPTLARISPPATQPAPPPAARELTDEQLLSLFPNTPVGLATLRDGKKLWLFLRPADAAKYATRL